MTLNTIIRKHLQGYLILYLLYLFLKYQVFSFIGLLENCTQLPWSEFYLEARLRIQFHWRLLKLKTGNLKYRWRKYKTNEPWIYFIFIRLSLGLQFSLPSRGPGIPIIGVSRQKWYRVFTIFGARIVPHFFLSYKMFT